MKRLSIYILTLKPKTAELPIVGTTIMKKVKLNFHIII